MRVLQYRIAKQRQDENLVYKEFFSILVLITKASRSNDFFRSMDELYALEARINKLPEKACRVLTQVLNDHRPADAYIVEEEITERGVLISMVDNARAKQSFRHLLYTNELPKITA